LLFRTVVAALTACGVAALVAEYRDLQRADQQEISRAAFVIEG
jgi:hypothetical protein